MRIVDRGIACASQPGTDRQSCCYPDICVLPDGRWMIMFRAAYAKRPTLGSHMCMVVSDDEGATWRGPVAPFAVPQIDGRAGALILAYVTPLGGDELIASLGWMDYSDPHRPFFNDDTEGLLDMRVLLSRSHDGGASWTAPEMVDTSPYPPPIPITGPVMLLPDGEWAIQAELNKPYEDTSPWLHAAVMLFSKDDGKTWPRDFAVGLHPENRVFYWDQRLSVLADGRILALFWSFDRVDNVYLNIQARESLDSGYTWSEMWDTGVAGQPGRASSLPDGRTLMPYVDRTAVPCIKVRVSSDHGRTWPEDTELAVPGIEREREEKGKHSMQDAWAEFARFSLGHPHSHAMPSGDTLLVYYAGSHYDRTSIHWARLSV